MFVDTELLRMGAGFSQSAGEIVQRGADRFAASQLPSGAFGDFDAAHMFHGALCRAHEAHVFTMQAHRSKLNVLAEKANSAAAAFLKQDEASESSLDAAAGEFA